MLSKIIEKSAAHCAAEAFLPDQVASLPKPVAPPHDTPDSINLNPRILQLEKALADPEAAGDPRGRSDAEAELQQRFSAAMQHTGERLAQPVKQVAEVRARLCKDAEADLLRLSLAIA